MSYRLEMDGEDWGEMESMEEAVDHADWLVSMPWHAPEAKGDKVRVFNAEGKVIFEKERTDFRPPR